MLPTAPGPLKLYLDFTSNKTEESLKGLDNMYLWYNLKALMPLKIEENRAPSTSTQDRPGHTAE
jgi:hypothetical protein